MTEPVASFDCLQLKAHILKYCELLSNQNFVEAQHQAKDEQMGDRDVNPRYTVTQAA